MILTASILTKHSRNTYIENLYGDDLNLILDKLRELERTKYGLKDDEYFPLSEMPDDIKELNDQFEKISDEKLIKLFKDHGLNTFADSYKENKDKFMARFYGIKDKCKAKLSDSILSIIDNLENESVKCANIQAFNAASILISSAIEGVLYHACSVNSKFIKELINYNKSKKKNNREKSSAELNFSELVKLAHKAGLLPADKMPEISSLLKTVNSIRNLIHPGRRLSADYHNIGQDEFLILQKIFTALRKTYKSS